MPHEIEVGAAAMEVSEMGAYVVNRAASVRTAPASRSEVRRMRAAARRERIAARPRVRQGGEILGWVILRLMIVGVIAGVRALIPVVRENAVLWCHLFEALARHL